MQRFKKHMMNDWRLGDERHKRPLLQCATKGAEGGKFIYGANGTLTQAARWRDAAFAYLNKNRQSRMMWTSLRRSDLTKRSEMALGKMNINSIASLLDSAHRGGCRLPA